MNSHAVRLLTYRLEKTSLFSVLCLALSLLGNASPLLTQEITHFNILFLTCSFWTYQPEQSARCKAFAALWDAWTEGPSLHVSCRLLGGAWRKQMAVHASAGVVNPCWTGLATWNDTLFWSWEFICSILCIPHVTGIVKPVRSGAIMKYPVGSKVNRGSDLKRDYAEAACICSSDPLLLGIQSHSSFCC